MKREDQDFKLKQITPFASKIWLSSPTMHGDEIKYIIEAYESNWMSTVGKNINEVEDWLSVCGCIVSWDSRFAYGGSVGRGKTR